MYLEAEAKNILENPNTSFEEINDINQQIGNEAMKIMKELDL